MEGDARLDLAVGQAIALHATLECYHQRLALRGSYDGVTCSGVPEAEALAERFQRESWASTSIEPRPDVVDLPSLRTMAVNTRVDVRGVVVRLEVRAWLDRPVRPSPSPHRCHVLPHHRPRRHTHANRMARRANVRVSR